ncbi:peptidoglycan-binding protein [Aerosakkonemataceae cyanobacterium BLCC-F154]|uniref:Peptidoglycan-binding protein n=1 Tax=Floridaenema fluviatile BLCC-F154 TaxID=3153640 RepID=A0ABV4YFQ5_9CYAN
MSVLARISVFLFPVSLAIGYSNLPAIAQGKVESVNQLVAERPPTVIVNRPVLKSGSKGEAVSELQAALKLLGYYKGEVDGVYSENTAIAVTQFQEAAGLNPDGIVDRETWEKLFPGTEFTANNSRLANRSNTRIRRTSSANQSTKEETTTDNPDSENTNSENTESPIADLPTLKIGMRGAEVFWLQKRLQAIGFFQGSVDGIFGKDTQAAVIAAQEKYGLKPDGIVGAATWQAILP